MTQPQGRVISRLSTLRGSATGAWGAASLAVGLGRLTVHLVFRH